MFDVCRVAVLCSRFGGCFLIGLTCKFCWCILGCCAWCTCWLVLLISFVLCVVLVVCSYDFLGLLFVLWFDYAFCVYLVISYLVF